MLITEAVQNVGLLLNTRCAGQGVCGGCAVDLYDGTYFQEGRGEFTVSQANPMRVLACRTKILTGPFRFSIPRRSLIETGERVVTDFIISDVEKIDPVVSLKSFDELKGQKGLSPTSVKPIWVCWEDGSWNMTFISSLETEKYFGLAVDIGTTTVAMSLVDFTTGKIVDTVSCYNQQIQVADDVIARIMAAGTPEGLEKLQRLIVHQTLNPLIQTLCRENNISSEAIVRMAVAGNTVMSHLFLGIDPSPMGVVPFTVPKKKPGSERAKNLGLAIYSEALVDIVPAISAYVGGDIVSDIVSTKLNEKDGLSLLIDIGTNGEIVLTDGREMFVTACAAGPAFEGLRISHGMRAGVGAIERITISNQGNECHIQTIGEARPIGICGSGLIDFIAEGFAAGVITPSGRLNRSLLSECPRLRIAQGSSQMLEYVLVSRCDTEDHTQDITVTEKDIETLLQAKAAIFAAIYLLLRRMNKSFTDLRRIILAGGFARYINIKNAITLGLLPEIDLSRYIAVGNASLAGAYLSLVDRSVQTAFQQISDFPTVVELNLDPEFQDEFTSALFIPNMQESLFPGSL
jgi:uncharacterized 2Fe-2S/4Fe-4S cluster protein (DUF4445 family)